MVSRATAAMTDMHVWDIQVKSWIELCIHIHIPGVRMHRQKENAYQHVQVVYTQCLHH